MLQKRAVTQSDKLSQKKAQKILNFLTDKKAILLMIFNIDVQDKFSKQSLVFQANDDSIISLSHAKQEMIAGINSLHYMEDDNSEIKKFLASATCDDGEVCGTIQGYEQSRVVTYRMVKH